MLVSLATKKFKSVYDTKLVFGCCNLFIGPNGGGKSNILEALAIVSACLSNGLDPSNLDERGIRLSVPTLFKSSFKKTGLSNTFRLEATFNHGRYECSIRAGLKRSSLEFHTEALFDGDTKVFGRGPAGITVNRALAPNIHIRSDHLSPMRGLWDVLSPIAKISDEFRAELEQFSQFSIYAPQTSIMRGIAVDPRLKTPLGLTGSGLANALEQVVFDRKKNQKFAVTIDRMLSLIKAPGWADGIRIKPFDPAIVPAQVKSEGRVLYIRDRFMITNRNYLSAFDASEGTLYLIFVAVLLAHLDAPSAFAVDNVDGTLNASLVRKVTDAIVEVCKTDKSQLDNLQRPRQVFVTSHHPSSLDSFDLFDDSEAVFVAYRDLQASTAVGSTKFERLLPPRGLTKAEWHERSGGKNLSLLLLDGAIKGAL